jgi:hypothetical protein
MVMAKHIHVWLDSDMEFAVDLYEIANKWKTTVTVRATSEQAAREIARKKYPANEYRILDVRKSGEVI